jgi:hypothetical protein
LQIKAKAKAAERSRQAEEKKDKGDFLFLVDFKRLAAIMASSF